MKRENFTVVIFDECNFIDCDFSGITLENVQFHNCTFKNVNFSNCVFNGILFAESKFIDKIDFTYSKIDDTIFVGCVGTEAIVMNEYTDCFKPRFPEFGSFIGFKCTDDAFIINAYDSLLNNQKYIHTVTYSVDNFNQINERSSCIDKILGSI